MKLETEHVFVCPLGEELNYLELRESQPRDLKDHTEFWNVWEKWPTSWSHPKDCHEFMMCFTEEVPCRDGQYSRVRTLDPGKDNDVPRSRVWTS